MNKEMKACGAYFSMVIVCESFFIWNKALGQPQQGRWDFSRQAVDGSVIHSKGEVIDPSLYVGNSGPTVSAFKCPTPLQPLCEYVYIYSTITCSTSEEDQALCFVV
jgi:hypothetical protein